VEEALIEMCLAGVSVRRVEDIMEALWGTKASPGTISDLNKKAYEHRESWRSFFVWLKERGLTGVRLIIGDKNLGILETMPEAFRMPSIGAVPSIFTGTFSLLRPGIK
jgi:transposase-like protein